MSQTARSAILRPGLPAPSQQRRQHAVENCLELCSDLGFLEEERCQEVSDVAQQACRYVHTSDKLYQIQESVAIQKDTDCYGSLLRPAELIEKVGGP